MRSSNKRFNILHNPIKNKTYIKCDTEFKRKFISFFSERVKPRLF